MAGRHSENNLRNARTHMSCYISGFCTDSGSKRGPNHTAHACDLKAFKADPVGITIFDLAGSNTWQLNTPVERHVLHEVACPYASITSGKELAATLGPH